MKKILTGLIVGAAAGLIDVLPMLIMGLPWNANLSAFALWIAVGVLTACGSMPLRGWMKGMTTAALIAAPVVLIVWPADPSAIAPMSVSTLILGALVGWLTAKYA